MLKEIVDYINDQRTLDSHYLSRASKAMGIDYYTLYRIVTGSRKGNSTTLEKMWAWYNKEMEARKSA